MRPEDRRDLLTLALLVAGVLLVSVLFMRGCGVYGRREGRISPVSQGTKTYYSYSLDPCAGWVYNAS